MKVSAQTLRIYNFILKERRDNKKMPLYANVCKHYNITKRELKLHLDNLVDAGKLNLNKTKYVINTKENADIVKLGIGKFNMSIPIMNVFTFVIFIIGIGMLFLSTKFSYEFMLKRYSMLAAVILAGTFTLFSSIAFELVIIFKKRKNKALVRIFSIIWVIVAGYSMYCTVGVQFDEQLAKNTIYLEENNTNNNSILLLKQYQEQVKEITIDIHSYREEREKAKELLFKTSTTSANFENVNWGVVGKTKAIKELQVQLNEVQAKIEIILKENAVNINKSTTEFGYHDAIASLFNRLSGRTVQFISYLFPAVFIELLAPLSFALVIFLQEKKKEN